jgi:two-component system, cell cycle sensor histidine kinase and response regulator CckA
VTVAAGVEELRALGAPAARGARIVPVPLDGDAGFLITARSLAGEGAEGAWPGASGSGEAELAALRAAIDALPLGVVIAEAGPATPPVMVAHNAGYERMIGAVVGADVAFERLPFHVYRPDRTTPLAPGEWPGPCAALTGEPVREQEIHLRRPDGGWRVLSGSAVPMATGPGTSARRAVSVLLDVTERHESERALRHYQALASHSRDVILFVRRDDGRILEANVAATATYGYSRAELLALTIYQLRDPAMQGLTARQLAAADAPGLRFETVHRRKDGSAFPVEMSSQGALIDGARVLVSVVRDVTERKRAEDALRRSEAELETVVDNVVDGVVVAGLDGSLLHWNRAALDLHGFASLEECRRNVGELTGVFELSSLDGSVLPVDEWPLARVLRGEQLRDLELRIRRLDGRSIRTFSYGGGLVRDAVGQPFIAVVTVRDVTERKRAEERLAAEKEHLAVTLRSIGDAVIATDANARVTLFNDVAERLTGWSAGEAIGRPVHEIFNIVNEETRRPADNPVDRVLREGVVVGLANHTALVARDGSERPIADSGAPIRDPGGRIIGTVLVFRDQTEERLAEDALRRSEAFYRAVFKASPDFWSVLDADGRDRFFSSGASAVVGWTQQELLSQAPFGNVHPEDRERLVSTFEALRAEPGGTRCETYRFQHRDGSWRTLESVARNLLDDPDVRGVVVNRRDVTAQRQLEEQFHQAQKLESIGRLAGGVAHDFHTLLTVILSCAEALGADLGSSHASADDVEEIRAAGQRARDLTRQLLTFARRQVIAPVALDLNDVVRGSEKLLRRLLGEDVELAVGLQRDPWSVRCDPGQVEQVIVNLAVNARDAMPRGGKLTIETSNVEEGEGHGEPGGQYVRLVVSDSGAGMTAEVKEHLFEPFFTTKPAGKGTGLGLATVYGIVAQSQGHIHVESAPGRGTRFQICLPRTLDRPQPVAASGTPAPRGTETILVVEDDAPVREVTVRSLRAGGYRVLVAASGREALDLDPAALGSVRLLVTDVVMPGIDGGALADALRGRYPALRVLFVSGYTQGAIAERGVVDSGMEFLQKPFTGPSLLARVRSALDAG